MVIDGKNIQISDDEKKKFKKLLEQIKEGLSSWDARAWDAWNFLWADLVGEEE
jgi:hypothetical protein